MKAGVAVVVVGDLASSPRMVNHARELARRGGPVTLVGLRDREFAPPAGVNVRSLRRWRRVGALGLAGAALRMTLTLGELLLVLLRRRPAAILLQNPPSFPTLLAGVTAARLLGTRLIVDWHNYGYTMLALRLGKNHWLVRLMERHEGWTARRAATHFCVSEAMRSDLERRFGVRALVLYDRPLELFPALRDGVIRPLVAVCASGWTADEDMPLLFDALQSLGGGNLELHLTGDGPLRARMEPRIASLRCTGINIVTGWLSEADYWALIRRSDIGLSLHRSSSGLDLAMKVVDLFAAGTPVCALDYGGSLSEQIRDGETGLFFSDAAELAGILDRLQRSPALLPDMRPHVRKLWNITWSEEWDRVAAAEFGKASQ